MANCSSCSAPLQAHTSVCEYCSTRNDVDLKGIHEFTVKKPISERICPSCAIPMQTINVAGGAKFYIERCEKCLGLFFDPGELQAILDKSVANVYRIDYKGLNRIIEDRSKKSLEIKYVKCPVCSGMMNRVNFGRRSGVIIDQCKGHGIWLDSGQLRQLMEWRKKGGRLLHEKRMEEDKKSRTKKVQSSERKPFQSPYDAGGAGTASGMEISLDFVTDVAETLYDLFRIK